MLTQIIDIRACSRIDHTQAPKQKRIKAMSNTIVVYSARELKELFPEAYEKVLERYRNDETEIFWQDEIIDSLKATFKQAGITLTDYSLGAYDRSFVRFTPPEYLVDYGDTDGYEDASDLTGKRAQNWIKAHVLDGASYKRVTYDKRKGGKGWRYDIVKCDGKDWSCEFTGYCADHDFIESLLDDIRTGCTLSEAFHNLADVCTHLLEQEYEYQTSEECFLETAEANEWKYTEYGRMI